MPTSRLPFPSKKLGSPRPTAARRISSKLPPCHSRFTISQGFVSQDAFLPLQVQSNMRTRPVWCLPLFCALSQAAQASPFSQTPLALGRHEKCFPGAPFVDHGWSHAPVCTEGREYCVYTSSSYNHHHGVSFIASPSAEREILQILQKSSMFVEQAREHLTPSRDLPYEVKEQPGRGRGVFARRLVRKGEVFLVGFPAVVIDQELERGSGPSVSYTERMRLYRRAYEQLPERNRILSLAASSGGEVYEDIIKTNGFGTGIGERRYSGVFPEIAMLNHDCRPK